MSEHHNHYETLGISRDAEASDVKRAWARLVREYSPDEHPEMNRRINEAKVTLLDPFARQDYDSMLDYGEELSELSDEAMAAEEDEDWEAAIRCYKDILALHPSNFGARNRLAICLSYFGQHKAAADAMRSLLERQPNSSVYWQNYGHILANASESPTVGNQKEIIGAFERAIALEPFNASHHLALSDFYVGQDEYDQAEQCIENAINADGRVEVDDLEAMFRLPILYLLSGQVEKISLLAERIRDLIPPDSPEIQKYAIVQFVRLALELHQKGIHDKAETFVFAAKKLGRLEGDLKEIAEGIERGAKIQREIKLLVQDSSILEAVKAMGVAYAGRYFDHLNSDQVQSRITDCLDALETWPGTEIVKSLNRLERIYPTVFSLNAELFRDIRSVAYKNQESPIVSQPYVSSASSGCCAIPVVVFIGVFLIIVFPLFR